MPSMSAGTRRLGEVLANPVGAREPAEIPGAGNRAGYEKRHGMLWPCRLALRQNGGRAKQSYADGRNDNPLTHDHVSWLSVRHWCASRLKKPFNESRRSRLNCGFLPPE